MLHRQTKTVLRTASRLLAAGLVAVLLIVSVLSASDALHRTFHREDAKRTNPCAACLLVKGHLENPAQAPVLTVPVLERASPPPTWVAVETGPILHSPPGRGPPIL